MNIFATEQGILGDTDYARQHNTFHAFLALARSIRKRLGAQAYKLDECTVSRDVTRRIWSFAPASKMALL